MNLAYLAVAVLAVSSPGDPSGPSSTVLLDFRAEWCGPCRSMDPVVGQLVGEGYPVRRVNIDQERELATRFGVQGIPCFVMVVNGKEVDRVVGATDPGRLQAMFSRNGVSPGINAARGQSPGNSPATKPVPFPPADRRGLLSRMSGNAGRDDDSSRDRMVALDPLIVSKSGPASTDASMSHEKLIRASVRLKIEDQTGNSCGSGTIIDARDGEALIITCGHVFRDAVQGGHILVDLFGPNAPHGVTGHLIDYDLKSEVGLIRIATNYPVVAARIAPAGFKVHTADDVISVGCDGGADATAKETHVTSINRYSGAKNLEVAFQPVQGRSGGGLFTPDGLVVGVCYAADPDANEGLFASLPALCDELDRMGLAFVYGEPSSDSRRADATDRARGTGIDRAVASSAPTVSRISPQSSRPTNALADSNVMPTSAKSYSQEPARPTPEDRAALQLIREKSQGAELICILRPTGDTQAKSEIFVLDRVSPGFMQQLTAERTASTQRLTSLELPRDNPADAKATTVRKSTQAEKPRSLDLPPWWADFLKP